MFGFGSNVLRRNNPTATNVSPRSPSPKKSSEIDTSVPFRSVKAAIGLFGESPERGSHQRSKSTVDERGSEKELQHNAAIKELESLQEQIKSIEASKAQALKDLDKAKSTLDTLTTKFEGICESKQAAILATEDAKKRLEELEDERMAGKGGADGDDIRKQYKECTAEINAVKQQITSLKQDFDAAMEEKSAALQEAAKAKSVMQENQEKAAKLSEEVSDVQRELDVAQGAQNEHEKLMADKRARIQSCKASKEEIENKIRVIKEDCLNGDENSNEKLEATNEAIILITERLNTVRASDMEDLNNITSELERAKRDLQRLIYEQNSLSSIVDSLRQKKEINTTFISQAEELKKQAEVYMHEAEEAMTKTEEIEKKLQIAMKEAKEAKAALKLDSIVKLPVEEYEELKKKAESSTTNGDFQVENGKTLLRKVEESQKENEALKIAIEDAKKQAEMANAARAMMEGELRKLAQ